MTERKHVRPREGAVIRDPATGAKLPPKGKIVVMGEFWERRRAEGHVEVTDPPVKARAADAPGPVTKEQARARARAAGKAEAQRLADVRRAKPVTSAETTKGS